MLFLEVQRRIHRRPAIYTSAGWWNQCTGGDGSFAGDPLWVAAYDVSDPVLVEGGVLSRLSGGVLVPIKVVDVDGRSPRCPGTDIFAC